MGIKAYSYALIIYHIWKSFDSIIADLSHGLIIWSFNLKSACIGLMDSNLNHPFVVSYPMISLDAATAF